MLTNVRNQMLERFEWHVKNSRCCLVAVVVKRYGGSWNLLALLHCTTPVEGRIMKLSLRALIMVSQCGIEFFLGINQNQDSFTLNSKSARDMCTD